MEHGSVSSLAILGIYERQTNQSTNQQTDMRAHVTLPMVLVHKTFCQFDIAETALLVQEIRKLVHPVHVLPGDALGTPNINFLIPFMIRALLMYKCSGGSMDV